MPSQDPALERSGGVPARMLNAGCPVRCSALHARAPSSCKAGSIVARGESENEGRRTTRQNRECLCLEIFPQRLAEGLCFAEWIGGSTARTRSHSAPVPCHSRSVRRDARVSLVQEEGGVSGVRSARGSPLFIHSFAHAAFDCGRPALWGWMDARQRWRTYTQSARARRCKKKGVGKSRTPCSWLQKDSMVRSRHCYGLSVSENANAGTST